MYHTNEDHAALLDELASLSSGEEYVAFQRKIIPGAQTVIGVRAPELRRIAKRLCKADWRGFLAMDDHSAHELDMLQAYVIAGAQCPLDERFRLIERFLPHIRNWAVCDAIAMDMKCVKKHQAEFWRFIGPLLTSKDEYTLRFPIVIMLAHFMNDEYIDRVLAALVAVRHDAYYVRMALAWAYSACFVRYTDRAMPLFAGGGIADGWVHNKAIQKTRESFRVSPETKSHLQTLRR